MNPLKSLNWKFAVAVALLLIAVPTFAQKRRAVRHPAPPTPSLTVTIQGTVLDAATNQPVVNAEIRLGNRTSRTDKLGKYKITTAINGTATITASRSGYVEATDNVSGDGDVNFRLQPTPTVRLRQTNGDVHDIDFESVEFGYVPTFGSYVKGPSEDFCRPGGAAVVIDRSEIERFIGPATSESHTACCATNPLEKINVRLKNGENTALYFADSCAGYSIDFIGRDHQSGNFVFVKFTDVAEIIFP